MSSSETIGAIIPVYNYAEYIEEALESLERQTLKPDLVVVIDDGSTDHTADLVNRYSNISQLQIKLVQQSNQGIAIARNTGTSRSSSYATCLTQWPRRPTILHRMVAILCKLLHCLCRSFLVKRFVYGSRPFLADITE
ncbi:MAG: glycosyltransferase family A protein [Salinisphaera sp.]|jgi:glycosyltransferase involved in cell wall biosynthesis|nr:glycosyltransferase family A protein [Salinisphaera sp.]